VGGWPGLGLGFELAGLLKLLYERQLLCDRQLALEVIRLVLRLGLLRPLALN
jgi:hypothetical protein